MTLAKTSFSQTNPQWRVVYWIGGVCTLAFMVFWLAPIPDVGLYLGHYAPLHTILEVFAVAVSAAIFAVGWSAPATRDSNILSLVAAGFLAVALLDIAHFMSFPGMPGWVTPSSSGKAIDFWFAARFAAAVTLLALILARTHESILSIRTWIAMAAAITYTAIALWLVLAHEDWLPEFIVPGKGLTTAKITLEWILIAISAFSIALLWRQRRQQLPYNSATLFLVLWLSILSELSFTLYSQVSDMFNLLGHVYKVLSYGFLYQLLVSGSVKRPYKLLAENQQILQQLTDNIHQVFWMSSPDKKQFYYISPAYESIWGRSVQSLLNAPESWLEAIHPDDRQRVSNSLHLQLDGTNCEEYRILRPDGIERCIRDRAFPIRSASGEVQRVAGVAEDITEQIRAEAEREKLQAQLLQAQKMESIGHLTGGIAHDFNNMLGAILGYAELLKKIQNSPMQSPDTVEKYINEILTAGNRAKELIGQMLVFSRQHSETKSSEVPYTLLPPVVKEVAHLLRSSLPSTIDVKYHIEDESLGARIQPVQLHQILLNLVINARDAIHGYGRIEVSLGQRSASGACDACHESFSDDYVELVVTDTGEGIPEHLRASIFDPFFTTKEPGKGTGMGLSVAHGIVHAVGGHIIVESTVNKGTSLRILLPMVAKKEIGAVDVMLHEMDIAHDALSGLQIMLVDDEPFIASMMEDLLNTYGATVYSYRQPKEALAAFEHDNNNIDLVITDETMPELSGLDMAVAMLELRPNLPIILCTGYSDHVDAGIAKQNGIAGFMYKPVEIPKLLYLVQQLVPKGSD